MQGWDEPRKKKNVKKSTQQVPFNQLGFKVREGQDLRTVLANKRRRYKASKLGPDNSKECFMGRLTFTLDIASLTQQQLQNLNNFKGVKKQEWDKVRQIKFQTKDELNCPICLETEFKAPQMTSCGHVFCWHCILMHHYKSLKANNCPVCNEIYSIETVATCKLVYVRGFKEIQSNLIKFVLRGRREGDTRIYNPATLKEELDFGRIVKVTKQKIIQIYEKELEEINAFLNKCDDNQVKNWVAKVVSLSWQKMQKITKQGERPYKPHRKQKIQDGFIYSTLDEKQRSSLAYFYQQKSGRLIFPHPITDYFIRKAYSEIPSQVEGQINYWEQAQYNADIIKKYRQISHLTMNQQLDLVIISLGGVDEKILKEYEVEIDNIRERQKKKNQRQDRQSERLSNEYQIQKEYMNSLKKMQQERFFDIKLPTTIDPKEIGDAHYFPSLISTKSSPLPTPPEQNITIPKKETVQQVFNISDFPELCQKRPEFIVEYPVAPLISVKSDNVYKQSQAFPNINETEMVKIQVKPVQNGKKGRKKKEKFTNVNDLIFKRDEEDEM